MSVDLTTAWPLRVRLGEVGAEGVTLTLSADRDARLAIAQGLDLLSLAAFTATVRVLRWKEGLHVNAEWSAKVERACSLTLESFDSDLGGTFDLRMIPRLQGSLDLADEIVVDLDAEDPPDVLDGDAAPIGALLVEHLALELEPFPRKPGARFEPPAEAPEPSPFAALARLSRPPD